MKPKGKRLLEILAQAAAPFALRAERQPDLGMPDLVFSDSDGREVGRLRWFDGGGEPYLRTVIPVEITEAEQRAFEAHLAARVSPVIAHNFSYPAWYALGEP